MHLLQAGANIYFHPKILVEHLEVSIRGQTDKRRSFNGKIENQKLYFYFYKKHFSKTLLKQQFYLDVIEGIKILLKTGKISKLKNCFKGYRLMKLMQ